jgi:hypothetical protein
LNSNLWLQLSVVLVAIGIACLVVNQAVYARKFVEFRDTALAWEDKQASEMLILVGSAYLVILLVAAVLKRTGSAP